MNITNSSLRSLSRCVATNALLCGVLTFALLGCTSTKELRLSDASLVDEINREGRGRSMVVRIGNSAQPGRSKRIFVRGDTLHLTGGTAIPIDAVSEITLKGSSLMERDLGSAFVGATVFAVSSRALANGFWESGNADTIGEVVLLHVSKATAISGAATIVAWLALKQLGGVRYRVASGIDAGGNPLGVGADRRGLTVFASGGPGFQRDEPTDELRRTGVCWNCDRSAFGLAGINVGIGGFLNDRMAFMFVVSGTRGGYKARPGDILNPYGENLDQAHRVA